MEFGPLFFFSGRNAYVWQSSAKGQHCVIETRTNRSAERTSSRCSGRTPSRSTRGTLRTRDRQSGLCTRAPREPIAAGAGRSPPVRQTSSSWMGKRMVRQQTIQSASHVSRKGKKGWEGEKEKREGREGTGGRANYCRRTGAEDAQRFLLRTRSSRGATETRAMQAGLNQHVGYAQPKTTLRNL